jgi:hypothetical protein
VDSVVEFVYRPESRRLNSKRGALAETEAVHVAASGVILTEDLEAMLKEPFKQQKAAALTFALADLVAATITVAELADVLAL